MTDLAITLALILTTAFVSLRTGYYIGRAQVVRDIKRMTKELNRRANHD